MLAERIAGYWLLGEIRETFQQYLQAAGIPVTVREVFVPARAADER